MINIEGDTTDTLFIRTGRHVCFMPMPPLTSSVRELERVGVGWSFHHLGNFLGLVRALNNYS